MIRIRGLRKRFGDRVALDGVDAEVAAGECVAVVGPSGCGKSTLLRCLNALTPFDEGQVEIAGFSVAPGASSTRTRALREVVGMVFQEWHLFPHLTALENVTLAPHIVARQPREASEAMGRDLLARVGLANRTSAYPSQLSGGQKQRVAIARALAMPLRVLLLDEPTSALDPAMREEVREVIRALAEAASLTLILATHEMRLAADLADRVWVMRDGRIAEEGKPGEVLPAFEGSGTTKRP